MMIGVLTPGTAATLDNRHTRRYGALYSGSRAVLLRICECVVTAVLGGLPPGSVLAIGVTRYGFGRFMRAFLLTCPRVAGPAWPTALS